MKITRNLTRTDISAIVSVMLFSLTILVSAVGPAEAVHAVSDETVTNSPPVGYMA